MNSVELGKRIKEARLAKKMTQSELVGDFITRNMLSRIESGNAYPSVKTLEYLASRLELSPGTLITDDPFDKNDSPSDVLINMKQLFLEERYEESAKLSELLFYSDFADEAYAVCAKCKLALAKRLSDGGDTRTAAELAKAALDYGAKGIFASREVQTEAILLLDGIAASALKKI